MQLLETFVHTLTGAEDTITSQAGPAAIQVQLDFRDMVAADVVVFRFTPIYTVGGAGSPSISLEIEHGASTSDLWDGTFGTNVTSWLSPILPFGVGGIVSLEQTVGTAFDVEVEVYGIGAPAP